MSRNLKVSSSDLDRLVNIEQRTPRGAANGVSIDEWLTVFTNVPAKVEQVGGFKSFTAEQMEAQFDYVITIRFKGVLNEKDYRVNYLGRILEMIRFPKELGRRQFNELTCRVRST